MITKSVIARVAKLSKDRKIIEIPKRARDAFEPGEYVVIKKVNGTNNIFSSAAAVLTSQPHLEFIECIFSVVCMICSFHLS